MTLLTPTARASCDLDIFFSRRATRITSKKSTPGVYRTQRTDVVRPTSCLQSAAGALMPLTYDDRQRIRRAVDARRRRALEGDPKGRWDTFVELARTEAGGDPIGALGLILDVRASRGLPSRQHIRRQRAKGT